MKREKKGSLYGVIVAMWMALLLATTVEGQETWGGFEVSEGSFVDTQSEMGWLNVAQAPWIYSYSLDGWLFIPEPSPGSSGFWLYALLNRTETGDNAVASAQFEPEAETYVLPQFVVITTETSDAVIRYTLDGSEPSESHGIIYTEPVTISGSKTLKALAYKEGMEASPVASGSYAITLPPVKPDETNTGYTGTLTASSSVVANTEGQVIENLEITGSIDVKANNVTIRNCKINGGLYGIRANYGYTGLLVEDCEIIESSSAAIYGSGFIARRLHIHEMFGDAIKANSDVLVESCYIHHLGKADGAHADGVQSRAGGSNMIFRWNNFEMPADVEAPYKANSAFIMQDAGGPITATLVEENWMNGGSYTYNGGGNAGITVRNNYFERDYNYGILYPNSAPVWYGNVWEDTGIIAQ